MSRQPLPQLLEIRLAGRSRVLRLRTPTAGRIVPLIFDRDIRTPALDEMCLILEVQTLVESIDGEEGLDESTAKQIVCDPEALAAILRIRNESYEAAVEQGRVFAKCPHCRRVEAELDVLFYWKTLSLPVWSFFDRGVMNSIPLAASDRLPGRRPAEVPCAAGMRIRFPIGDGIFEHRLSSARSHDGQDAEHQMYAALVDSVVDQPDGRSYWRRDHPGFRAMLRLAIAVQASPDEIEALPFPLLLFLDLVHFATSDADVPSASRAAIICRGCDGKFLPAHLA